jgi:hypothetical protein
VSTKPVNYSLKSMGSVMIEREIRKRGQSEEALFTGMGML